MSSQLGSIIQQSLRNDWDKLNILCMPTHPRFESHLCLTGHSFFSLCDQPQSNRYPSNYFEFKELPYDIDIDIVLSQEKQYQYPRLKQIANSLNVPFICLEHTLPPNNYLVKQCKSYVGDVNVFLGDYAAKAWGCDSPLIIPNAVDTKLFTPRGKTENVLLSVVSKWKERDFFCGYRLWTQVTKDLPVQVFGDNPGLSEMVGLERLVQEYGKAKIFLNTSLNSTFPMSLMEAMSAGCAIVSTATGLIPEYLTHNENALLSNDPERLREYCLTLLQDNELCSKLGENARSTAIAKLSLPVFIHRWKAVFEGVARENKSAWQ